jgi:hypothetical protein
MGTGGHDNVTLVVVALVLEVTFNQIRRTG